MYAGGHASESRLPLPVAVPFASMIIGPHDPFPFVREHPPRILPLLPTEYHHGLSIERDRNCLPPFGLIGMNPGDMPL